ncbi:hypothetical protein Cgig2_014179 [Carnegiea gigantea]|uniref:Uncharacterized protein n=1 Tax=Carnegiea gigantea TaxID=171969 RepID=A0A9Q1K707_9CARY|nr:hypothetical protein Cgig2_014179 [Carnegiea gigantea]
MPPPITICRPKLPPMATSRGGMGSNNSNRASKGQPLAAPAQPKHWSNRIAIGLAKRLCNHCVKTTMNISDTTMTIFDTTTTFQNQSSSSPSSLCFIPSRASDVVYPKLVRLFYANLETKFTPKGTFFMSIMKSIKITLSHSILESIFGLKFIKTTPSNLTRKRAKDLCLAQFAYPQKLVGYKCQTKAISYSVPRTSASNLTPEEGTALKISFPNTLPAPNVATVLAGLQEDNAAIRHQLD